MAEDAGERRVAVIGTGLLGTSVALAARRAGATVVGFDADAANLREAADRGALDPAASVAEAVRDVDVIVLAVPVSAMPGVLAALPTTRAVVTDTASTKRSVLAAVPERLRSQFVAAHPMAGGEQAGPAAAEADLFDGRVCHVVRGTSDHDAFEVACAFWRSVGATVSTELDAATHDDLMAAVSHGPHLTAAALLLAAGDRVRHAGPGLRDTTRVASGDPALWADILLDNAVPIATALERIERELGGLRDLVRRADHAALLERLARAKESRETLL